MDYQVRGDRPRKKMAISDPLAERFAIGPNPAIQ
jgi:hypothetical protein